MLSRLFWILLLALGASLALASPSAAVTPYVRFDFGGSDPRMNDMNDLIHDNQQSWREAGYPVALPDMGYAYGPSAVVGVWLGSTLRVGATCTYEKATWGYHVNVPPVLYFSDSYVFHVVDVGAEAALRCHRLHGFIVGANVGRARADMNEVMRAVDATGSSRWVVDADRARISFGGYVGFDQTNASGAAGYVRAGFQYRDMGHMPGHQVTTIDGATTIEAGETKWMDYSGFYLRVGVGYDWIRRH
jgi:hypothetical protein